jgi:Fur family ferric uptake transcriptional regulator
MRLTRQRKIIIENLSSLKTHPTANDLYALLRDENSSLSFASLYRNLEVLSRDGLVKTLDGYGQSKRFDARTDDHFHFHCLACGTLVDYIPLKKGKTLVAMLDRILLLDKSLCSVKIEFNGFCKECLKKRRKKV